MRSRRTQELSNWELSVRARQEKETITIHNAGIVEDGLRGYREFQSSSKEWSCPFANQNANTAPLREQSEELQRIVDEVGSEFSDEDECQEDFANDID
ncbi:hypothetical protein X975_25660, partial [Stegodyphus mimosarum]